MNYTIVNSFYGVTLLFEGVQPEHRADFRESITASKQELRVSARYRMLARKRLLLYYACGLYSVLVLLAIS